MAFEHLKFVANEDAQEPDEYLEDYDGGLTGFLTELLSWCAKQLEEANERQRILAMAEKVRQKRLVLPGATLALFSRYQTTLDNQPL